MTMTKGTDPKPGWLARDVRRAAIRVAADRMRTAHGWMINAEATYNEAQQEWLKAVADLDALENAPVSAACGEQGVKNDQDR